MSSQIKHSRESRINKYEFGKLLGKGSFGSCYVVRERLDRTRLVCKQVNLTKMPRSERDSARREVKVLSQLRHPNIVGYKEAFMDNRGNLNIVMEFCAGGDLYGRIKNARGVHFTEEKILDWFVQMSLALQFIHSKNILHRDLKTQNIFLTKNDVIKLGDFGIARYLEGTMDMAKTLIGTPYYMSPELCSNKPYDYKSDVWALGCVLYEMCTLKHAFTAQDLSGLVFKILKGQYPPIPSRYSKDLQRLIRKCLSRDPKERPSIDEMLQEPFIKARMESFVAEAEDPTPRPAEISRRTSASSASSSPAVGASGSSRSRASAAAPKGSFTPQPGVSAAAVAKPSSSAAPSSAVSGGSKAEPRYANGAEAARARRPTAAPRVPPAQREIITKRRAEQQKKLNEANQQRKSVEEAFAKLDKEREWRRKQFAKAGHSKGSKASSEGGSAPRLKSEVDRRAAYSKGVAQRNKAKAEAARVRREKIENEKERLAVERKKKELSRAAAAARQKAQQREADQKAAIRKQKEREERARQKRREEEAERQSALRKQAEAEAAAAQERSGGTGDVKTEPRKSRRAASYDGSKRTGSQSSGDVDDDTDDDAHSDNGPPAVFRRPAKVGKPPKASPQQIPVSVVKAASVADAEDVLLKELGPEPENPREKMLWRKARQQREQEIKQKAMLKQARQQYHEERVAAADRDWERNNRPGIIGGSSSATGHRRRVSHGSQASVDADDGDSVQHYTEDFEEYAGTEPGGLAGAGGDSDSAGDVRIRSSDEDDVSDDDDDDQMDSGLESSSYEEDSDEDDDSDSEIVAAKKQLKEATLRIHQIEAELDAARDDEQDAENYDEVIDVYRSIIGKPVSSSQEELARRDAAAAAAGGDDDDDDDDEYEDEEDDDAPADDRPHLASSANRAGGLKARIQTLKDLIGKGLEHELFKEVYTYLRDDDQLNEVGEEVYQQNLRKMLGEDRLRYAALVVELIFCEDSYYGASPPPFI